MKLELTNRGFTIGDFVDEYGEKCSIQKSSLATKDCIWLGVNEVRPKVCVYGQGWKEIPLPEGAAISGRMHLSQKLVKELLPFLQHFAETGELPETLGPREWSPKPKETS